MTKVLGVMWRFFTIVARVLASSAAVVMSLRSPHRGTTESWAPVMPDRVGPPPPGPPGELFLPEANSDSVAVIDTATNRTTRRIRLCGGARIPMVVAASPDGRKVYVDNYGHTPPIITVIDRVRGTERNIEVSSLPVGAFLSADRREIFLPERDFIVEVLDIATDRIVRRFHYPDVPVAALPGPDGLMYVGLASGMVMGVDPRSGAIVRPPRFVGGIFPFWYSFTADGRKMYVDAINAIGVVDLRKWRLVKRIHTARDGRYSLLNPGPFTSTVSPDGSKLYVTMFGRQNVLVIDTDTDRVLREIPTLGNTTAVVFSDDGTRGYISDLGPSSLRYPTPIGEMVLFAKMVQSCTLGRGQLVVFDPRSDTVLGQIPTGRAPAAPVWLPPLAGG